MNKQRLHSIALRVALAQPPLSYRTLILQALDKLKGYKNSLGESSFVVDIQKDIKANLKWMDDAYRVHADSLEYYPVKDMSEEVDETVDDMLRIVKNMTDKSKDSTLTWAQVIRWMKNIIKRRAMIEEPATVRKDLKDIEEELEEEVDYLRTSDKDEYDMLLRDSKYKSLLSSLRAMKGYVEQVSEFVPWLLGFIKKMESYREWTRSEYDSWDKVREGPPRSKVRKLYHATTNISSILKGFRRPDSMKDKALGLGGANDNMISTTGSREMAIEIARALREVSMIVRGEATWKDLEKWMVRDKVKKEVSNRLGGWIGGIKMNGEDALDMLLKGYIVDSKKNGLMTEDEMPKNAIPAGVGGKPSDWNDGKRRYLGYWRPATNSEREDILFDLFRKYLEQAEAKGTRFNPVFFSVSASNFKRVDPSKVGVVELKVDMNNPEIKYVQGMYEFRIPPESIKLVKRIV